MTSRHMLALGAALFCAAVTVAGAQRSRPSFAGAVEFRSAVGTNPADSTTGRSGLALRVLVDGAFTPIFGWRIEGAYTQANYKARLDGSSTPIAEAGLEGGGYLRFTPPVRTAWHPYAVAGSVISARGDCSVDNPFEATSQVNCGTGQAVRVGWGAGVGARARGLAGWDWMFEVRMLGNTTSGGTGRMVTFAFGAGM